MADSDFKEQGEHVMGFFKQKGPLQRDFCEVLLYVVALWALKPASLQDILTVNQCDGMWFFSAAFFAIVFVGIVSDYLLITNHFVAWKAIHGNVNQTTFATVYKGNIIKNLIMDCQSYTKYRPNETTGGIFVSWRRKEELPTGA